MVETDREWLHRVGFRSFGATAANGEVAPKAAVEFGIDGFSCPTRRDNGGPRRGTAPRNETALPSIEHPGLDELAAAMGRDPARSEVIPGRAD